MYDIIIVGGGPAGMTAALYALRNGKSVLVLEKTGFGGQIVHSPKVENWPGTARMSGNEYADHFLEQILDQGAEVDLTEVVRVEDHGDRKTVTTADGETREARSVILATGVRHRELGLTGEREMTGEGVSYCAVCDADFFRGKKVCVAGGGNSALQEAMLLAGKCSEVVMLQDLPEFTGEKKLQELLFSKPNVSARTGVKIVDLGMDEHVREGGRNAGDHPLRRAFRRDRADSRERGLPGGGEAGRKRILRQPGNLRDGDAGHLRGGRLPGEECAAADHRGGGRIRGGAGGLQVRGRAAGIKQKDMKKESDGLPGSFFSPLRFRAWSTAGKNPVIGNII